MNWIISKNDKSLCRNELSICKLVGIYSTDAPKWTQLSEYNIQENVHFIPDHSARLRKFYGKTRFETVVSRLIMCCDVFFFLCYLQSIFFTVSCLSLIELLATVIVSGVISLAYMTPHFISYVYSIRQKYVVKIFARFRVFN